MRKLFVGPLFIVLLACQGSLIETAGQQPPWLNQKVAEIAATLKTQSDKERETSVSLLTSVHTIESCQLLLRILKDNVAHNRGNIVKNFGNSLPGGGYEWGYIPSQNWNIVQELGLRKCKEALPFLLKMYRMKGSVTGMSQKGVAISIYMITSRPVRYIESDDTRIYPDSEEPSDDFGELDQLADGEKQWDKSSPGYRLRDLACRLSIPGRPAENTAADRKTLNEELGLAKLIALAKDGDPLVRPYAVELIGFTEDWKTTIPLLIELAGDRAPRVRYQSIKALGYFPFANFKPEEAAIITALLEKAYQDPEPNVRYSVIYTVSRYAGDARTPQLNQYRIRFIPLLQRALHEHSSTVRYMAISTLGYMGPLTPQVIPLVVSMLKAPDKDDRFQALIALRNLAADDSGFFKGPKERDRIKLYVINRALEMTGDPESVVREEVAEILGQIGPVDPRVIPTLIKLSRDRARIVRFQVARSLWKFEEDRVRFLLVFARMLTRPEEDPELLEHILRNLTDMGPEARSAAPQVRKLLKSDNDRTRQYAGYAIEAIDPPSSPKKK